MTSIDQSSADDNSDEKSISKYDLEDVWDGIYVHQNINSRDASLKMRDHIKQSKNEWKRRITLSKNYGQMLK